MVRRKQENIVDVLFEVSAMMPWWAGVIAAVVTYFVCHSFATAEVAAAKNMSQFAPAIQQTIIKALASIAQYVLPMIFLAGAAASAIAQARRRRAAPSDIEPISSSPPRQPSLERTDPWNVPSDQDEQDIRRIRRSDPVETVPPPPVDTSRWSAQLLSALEWKRFERVCAGLFERLGFTTKAATTGADGGVDIHLFRPPGEQAVAIVQCKAWTGKSKVGVHIARELHGVMASMRVAEGILATTTTFSNDAQTYAHLNHIELMDGRRVLEAIQALTDEQQHSLLRLATDGDYTTPTCASCGVKMTLRTPKSGGKQFWGCVNFPRCNTTMRIREEPA